MAAWKVAVALLFAVPCLAQQGTVAGRVLDSTNGLLPGVTIEAGR
ncbi:MAG TPA: hypothetical protein VKB93_02105 [Thermoanaerobaculia bacterium]|nr:hypothetical protein [Thermoanaerobaculia bacterium]